MNNIPLEGIYTKQELLRNWRNYSLDELGILVRMWERKRDDFMYSMSRKGRFFRAMRAKSIRSHILDYELKIHTLRQMIWQRSQAETRAARLHAAEYQDYLDTMNDVRYAGCL